MRPESGVILLAARMSVGRAYAMTSPKQHDSVDQQQLTLSAVGAAIAMLASVPGFSAMTPDVRGVIDDSVHWAPLLPAICGTVVLIVRNMRERPAEQIVPMVVVVAVLCGLAMPFLAVVGAFVSFALVVALKLPLSWGFGWYLLPYFLVGCLWLLTRRASRDR